MYVCTCVHADKDLAACSTSSAIRLGMGMGIRHRDPCARRFGNISTQLNSTQLKLDAQPKSPLQRGLVT